MRLTQSKKWVGVDHVAWTQILDSPPMTNGADKNEMIMIKSDACMNNVNIKCRLSTLNNAVFKTSRKSEKKE